MKTTDSIKYSLSRSPCRRGFLLIPFIAGFACFALSPVVRAVCRDGCDSAKFSVFLGEDALANNTGFGFNTAIGYNALYSNTTGEQNTAVGLDTLYSNTTGFGNVAIGTYSLDSNTTGSGNTAIHGMEWNSTGSYNTAVGFTALEFNRTGNNNTAIGNEALFGDSAFSTGSFNTATGDSAIHSNIDGSFNVANGASALYANTTGNYNTADGAIALASNTTGDNNTALGKSALSLNSSGLNNTACGWQALLRNTTGSSNIGLGDNAGSNLTTGSNNIDIGNLGVAGEAGTIRIGTTGTHLNTYIAGIYQVPLGRVALPVGIDSSGHLGTKSSSARFKQNIKPMDKASEAILALKPVTFNYKKELDPEGTPQFGLVAEEVEKVNPALVDRGPDGKVYTVRYDAVNAMLLNEFQKEHRKVVAQDRRIQEQETAIAKLQKQIEALTAGLQRVSDELELSKAAPRTVVSNP